MRLLLFCVNYNSYEKLAAYLASIDTAAAKATADVTVIVADNSNPAETIDTQYPNLTVQQSITNANLGYLGAVTYAIQHCGLPLNAYDYCAISNVDLTMAEDFFLCLQNEVVAENTGCIAPSIYSLCEKTDRNPKILTRPTRKRIKLLRIMYTIPLLYTLYYKIIYAKKSPQAAKQANRQQIYAPHGSFMLFTKQFSPFLQTFVYPAFLFGEEIYFAENLRKAGLSAIYTPDVKVIDADHESTGKLKRKTFFKWNRDALTMLLGKYFNE